MPVGLASLAWNRERVERVPCLAVLELSYQSNIALVKLGAEMTTTTTAVCSACKASVIWPSDAGKGFAICPTCSDRLNR